MILIEIFYIFLSTLSNMVVASELIDGASMHVGPRWYAYLMLARRLLIVTLPIHSIKFTMSIFRIMIDLSICYCDT